VIALRIKEESTQDHGAAAHDNPPPMSFPLERGRDTGSSLLFFDDGVSRLLGDWSHDAVNFRWRNSPMMAPIAALCVSKAKGPVSRSST
jgi:hypothetical protein